MIRDNVKISLDYAGAQQEELSQSFVYEMGYDIPEPKTSAADIFGRNGMLDLSDTPRGVCYKNRTVALSLVAKNTPGSGANSCQSFVNKYHGQTVRIYVGTSFYFRGRCIATADNLSKLARHLCVTVDADPLAYDVSYTPSDSGQTISPSQFAGGLWNASNVSTTSSYGTVDVDGGTISAAGVKVKYTISSEAAAGRILFIRMASPSFEIQSVSKAVKIKDINGHDVYVVAPAGSVDVVISTYEVSLPAQFVIDVYNLTKTTITNSGKQVPLEVSNGYAAMSVNFYLFVNGQILKLPLQGFSEMPEFMLSSGDNTIAVIPDNPTFTPPTVHGYIKVRYRRGVLCI